MRPRMPTSTRPSITSSVKRMVPASRKAVVPDLSISTDANWADRRSSAAVYTEYRGHSHWKTFSSKGVSSGTYPRVSGSPVMWM